MIARLHVLLPFSLAIPDGEEFILHPYVEDGYGVVIYPPKKSKQGTTGEGSAKVLINGVTAFQADVLHIDFHKDSFDRGKSIGCDPPEDLIARVINSFLAKMRFVTRASQVHPIDFPFGSSWNLRYLNDDESELEEKEDSVRGRFARRYSFSWIGLNKDGWENIFSLSEDYIPPTWDSLLLDAHAALPEVGLSVVLTATALEVFISNILDQLAQNSPVPGELWKWINGRAWLREPTTEEQFDDLLRILSGRSLKEDTRLWEAFKNLKNARNSFVHEGMARIGSCIVSKDEAAALIMKAREIVKYVRSNVPSELHWPEFQSKLKIQAELKILGD